MVSYSINSALLETKKTQANIFYLGKLNPAQTAYHLRNGFFFIVYSIFYRIYNSQMLLQHLFKLYFIPFDLVSNSRQGSTNVLLIVNILLIIIDINCYQNTNNDNNDFPQKRDYVLAHFFHLYRIYSCCSPDLPSGILTDVTHPAVPKCRK